MTDEKKYELLNQLEKASWEALNALPSFGPDRVYVMRNLLYSIELIKEMRIDYEPSASEETDD